MTACDSCRAPDRELYGPGHAPHLSDLDNGNWISLSACAACGALWCVSCYEPYAAYQYGVRWTFSAGDWRHAHDLDDGRTLLRWHATAIRTRWQTLPNPEREAVDAHRRRSMGHNPIDSPAAFGTLSEPELMRQIDRSGRA
jgi:hypothetical protein